VAAAAGLVGAFAAQRLHVFSPAMNVCNDVIAKHRRNLPVEVTGGTNQVKDWYADKELPFPVKPPSFGARVSLRGGRLADIGEQQAAMLVYDDAGTKVSVFLFDPSGLKIDEPRRAQRRIIGNREVFLDEERGYNVALYREHGVGYAIASDLNQDQLIKLVSSAVTP
jgi:anti-sigma factor RsiW